MKESGQHHEEGKCISTMLCTFPAGKAEVNRGGGWGRKVGVILGSQKWRNCDKPFRLRREYR
jgi:hypothetical protein